MRGTLGVVLHKPFRGHFMWPFDVAGLCGSFVMAFFGEMGSTVEETLADGGK
jgi:hypothetical protein